VVEIDERLVLSREGETLPEHRAKDGSGALQLREVTGITGERLLVERAPDEAAVRSALTAVHAAGIRAVAIAFMHSYAYPEHERIVGRIAGELGFTQVSLSSEVMPMVKIVPRGYTACADAYLTPHIVKYVDSFRSGFAQGLASAPGRPCATQLSFMQSDGGLTPVEFFSGHRAILSGPAGGVVGYALTTWDAQRKQPIVAFDMGGTSTGA
jgi:5-oxoprolinase (ATP-hydrolysing)